MNKHPKCAQLDQCSVCCMWVDTNAGAEHAACPACPYRDAFAESAALRRSESEQPPRRDRAAA